jgi:hypothetical protein
MRAKGFENPNGDWVIPGYGTITKEGVFIWNADPDNDWETFGH